MALTAIPLLLYASSGITQHCRSLFLLFLNWSRPNGTEKQMNCTQERFTGSCKSVKQLSECCPSLLLVWPVHISSASHHPSYHQNTSRLKKRLGQRLCPNFLNITGPRQRNRTLVMLFNKAFHLNRKATKYSCSLQPAVFKSLQSMDHFWYAYEKHPLKSKFALSMLKFIVHDSHAQWKEKT